MGGAFYLYAECFEPTLTWGDGQAFRAVEIMHDFFSGLPYWKLNPHSEVVNAGTVCLADPGKEYVIYRQNGGAIILDLANVRPEVSLNVQWLNPRTGAKKPAGSVNGGAKRSFDCPDAQDWVLHLNGEPRRK